MAYRRDQQFFLQPMTNLHPVALNGAPWDAKGSTSFSIEYPIIYDKNDWRITAIQYEIKATQTYAPFSGSVKFPFTFSVRSYNPDGKAQLGSDTFSWALIGADEEKRQTIASEIAGTPPERASFILDGSYVLPIKTVTAERLNINSTISALLRANRDGVTSTPSWGQPLFTSADLDLGFLVIAGAAGLLAIGGLYGLGYASEKTGLNVKSVSNVASGLFREIGKGANNVMSILKK